MRFTRRTFLAASGVGSAALLTACSTSHHSSALPAADGVLVLVTCYGGNDGLNTVVPASDPLYAKARPTLGYDASAVLPLADGLGLNPALKRMKAFYDKGNLAIVRGVGYPQPDHSHFRSMAIWQTASPAEPTTTGWLGRWLDTQSHDPLHAIAVGPAVPPLLVGARSADAAVGVGALAIPPGFAASFGSLAASEGSGFTLATAAAAADQDLLTVVASLGPALSAPSSRPAGAGLAAELGLVSRCIAAGAPTRVYSVTAAGFDRHVGEKCTHEALLGDLDTALGGFMDSLPAGHNVTVAVYSEFGRRLAENDGDGTDHGEAGPVFVLGNAVRGGLYGDEPSLSKLDDGDIVYTADFRDVYAELLTGVLAADPGPILPGRPGHRIGFLT